MEESTANALLAHISRLENELLALRKTVAALAAGDEVRETSVVTHEAAPMAVSQSETDATNAGAANAAIHPSGLELSQGLFLEQVFRAAQIEDEERRSELLGDLTHSASMVGPRSIEYLKAFNWKQLVKNAASYLDGGNVDAFRVTRCEPSDPKALKVKIFLKPADGRHPAPILLERDPAKDGDWRIAQISL